MLFVRVNEAHSSCTQTMASAIDRKFDRSFADKPHLRVKVMVRRVRIPIWRESRLVRFEMLTGGQLAFDDFPNPCVV